MNADDAPRAEASNPVSGVAPSDPVADAVDSAIRSVGASLTDNLMLLDREGRIRYINWTAPGVAAESVIGSDVYGYVTEEYRETMRRCHERVFATGSPDRFETAFVTEGGDASWWETRVSPVVRAKEIVGLVQISSNVTERRQAAADRDRLFNLSLDMLCVAGTDGYFKRLNPAFEHALGFTVEELQSRPFLEFAHPDDRARTEEAVQRLRDGQLVTDFDNRYRCRDGSYRWISWRASPDTTGTVIYAIGRDVTERRKLEQQLHHSQKMDAVGQLAGGIAHDFNNLVLAIELNTQLALRSEDAPARASYLHEVQGAAQRAADLTRQLLAFARRRPAQLAPVRLDGVVAGMQSLLRRLIPASIEIVVDAGDSLPAVLADAAQLEQVLLNLCVNARDAMPGGGRLTIETREARPPGRTLDYVRLAVRDTGCGMSSEVRERVFEPFFTTKPAGQGTGLGLATVYAIVEQHKGGIRIESEPGEGASFEVYLPTSDASPEVRAPVAATAASGGSETILVAEDESGVRGAVARLLESVGYRVLAASDGAEAVQLFEAHASEIGLLLFDMVMPKLGGMLAAERIRGSNPHVPIIFMSGYASASDLGVVALAGAARLDKPYESSTLLRMVRETLDAARSERASAT